jgi:hypothetical protein
VKRKRVANPSGGLQRYMLLIENKERSPASSLPGFCSGRLQRIARAQRKGESHRHCAERHARRADIQPAIGIEGVKYPAKGQRTECHAEARAHCRGAEHRAHDALTEIFTRQHPNRKTAS